MIQNDTEPTCVVHNAATARSRGSALTIWPSTPVVRHVISPPLLVAEISRAGRSRSARRPATPNRACSVRVCAASPGPPARPAPPAPASCCSVSPAWTRTTASWSGSAAGAPSPPLKWAREPSQRVIKRRQTRQGDGDGGADRLAGMRRSRDGDAGPAVAQRRHGRTCRRRSVGTAPRRTGPDATGRTDNLTPARSACHYLPIIDDCHVRSFLRGHPIIRSCVRTLLDHVFEIRTCERACRKNKSGHRQLFAHRDHDTRDTVEQMFDSGRYRDYIRPHERQQRDNGHPCKPP